MQFVTKTKPSTSFPNFQPLLNELPFPDLFHPPAHISSMFRDELEMCHSFAGLECWRHVT